MNEPFKPEIQALASSVEGAADRLGLDFTADWKPQGDGLRLCAVVRGSDLSPDEFKARVVKMSGAVKAAAKQAGLAVTVLIDIDGVTGKIDVLFESAEYLNDVLDSDMITAYELKLFEVIESQVAKRIYRKRHELNDPTKPTDSNQNRVGTRLLSTRIEAGVADAVDEFRSASGMTKKAIIEKALEEFLAKQRSEDPDFSMD